MNNNRRKLLKSAIDLLDKAYSIVDSVLNQEEDSLGNMPENLQMSERCENMETAIGCLEDAESSIDDARDRLREAL